MCTLYILYQTVLRSNGEENDPNKFKCNLYKFVLCAFVPNNHEQIQHFFSWYWAAFLLKIHIILIIYYL